MDKYRMLVTGKNESFIEEMELVLEVQFDILGCSKRYSDQIKHINLFDPHVFAICLNGESPEEMKELSELKRKLTSMDVFTLVIGSASEIELFEKNASQLADLAIVGPKPVEAVRDEILVELHRIEEEKLGYMKMLQNLEGVRNSGEKKHVLVVDDDPIMLKLIKEYIGDRYNVATAVNGKVATKFLETKETNLILLDYEMPEENGVEVLKKIRSNSKVAGLPVIFLTGVTDKSKLMEALQLKPQGYLIKPIDKEKLMGTLEKFIG